MSIDAIELDLEKIERLGQLREDENYRFRGYLKEQDSDEIDVIVHGLNREISGQIDCTKCGNCCRKLKPCITDQDLDILTRRLKMTLEQIEKNYTGIDEGDRYFANVPCSFLEDKKCTIYEDRPADCRSFPHLHKKDFVFRLFSVIDNYSVCPIVFNVFEALKKELNFR